MRLFNIHFVAEHQKIEGETLWGILFEKKSMPKKSEREDPLVSPGIVCYAEKHKKPFWFSSLLSQMFQFGIMKKMVSSYGLKKSHYNSRVSLHEAPTKKESL